MMRVTFATEAAPGHESDDLFLDAKEVAGVFDGVTKPIGIETGCVHGAAWYVGKLASEVGALVGSHRKRCSDIVFDEHTDKRPSLPGLLAEAIERVRGWHVEECDLTNPSTPAASLCLIRTVDDRVEYLVLCDAVLVLETADGIEIVTDKRFQGAMADLPLERAARELEKRKLTNQSCGYWVAAATPEAAHHALIGSFPLIGPRAVKRAALLTDGAARAVDEFGFLDWRELLDLITDHGPDELIRQVRTAELRAPEHHLHKRHDDATVALCLFE
ncbi:MAG TPA: hypothetical protein DGG94_13720 [Micromonosporaceae bacterium]|nr:hypothetical protein [Micromonosporaceae bacterium]HCU50834.1 hypothetical protein [Micromonosporaceae bacterium]